MPANPLWLGALLILLPPAARADPDPSATPGPPVARDRIPPAVVLDGKPFPPVTRFVAGVPSPARTLFVSAKGEKGDGTKEHPWNDLQAALGELSPGDRLQVLPGDYSGSFGIDERCKEGTPRRPIQVFFAGKAKLLPLGEGAVLTIRQPHWHVSGVFIDLEQSANAGVHLEGAQAHDVTLDGARVSGGAGPSIRIGGETARVRIANSRVAKTRLERASPDAIGIDVAAGARGVLLTNNQLRENPGGSVRVHPPAAGGRAAGGLRIEANSIHDDATTAIEIEAADGVQIAKNTISDTAGSTGTVGISLGRVMHAGVSWNHISGCETGVRIGRALPGAPVAPAQDVSVDHNAVEHALAAGTGIRVEAADRVKVIHNVVDDVVDGIVVLGAPPQTRAVSVTDNLLLRVFGLAFAMDDAKAVETFDYNIFSPAGSSLDARVGGRQANLTALLKEGVMPHTKLILDLHFFQHDLARISGMRAAPQATRVPGIAPHWASPDLGTEAR